MVETLLLRWTMLDRIVDLEEVLAGRGGGPRARPRRRRRRRAGSPAPAASPPPVGPRTAAPGPTPVPAPAPRVRLAASRRRGRALSALREAWTEIVAEVRDKSRFLGEALGGTAPAAVELPWLTVELSEPNPLFAERLQSQAGRPWRRCCAAPPAQTLRLRVTDGGKGGRRQRPAAPADDRGEHQGRPAADLPGEGSRPRHGGGCVRFGDRD